MELSKSRKRRIIFNVLRPCGAAILQHPWRRGGFKAFAGTPMLYPAVLLPKALPTRGTLRPTIC